MWRFRIKLDNTFDGFKKSEVPLGVYRQRNLIAKKEEKSWYVITYAKGDKYIELLTIVVRDIEEILDKVSFQIMNEVTIQEILMTNMTKVFRKTSENKFEQLTDEKIKEIDSNNCENMHLQEWIFSHGFKNQRGNWKSLRRLQTTKRGNNPIVNNRELDNVDKNALKWFVKALGTLNEVDQFTNYIICLDMLAHKIQLEQRKPICPKCKNEINYVHDCGEQYLMQPYAIDYLKSIGLSEEDAKKFNKLRNTVFHGKKSLSSERLDEILDLNNKLKRFLTEKFRTALKIEENDAPILNENMVMVQDMHLQGYTKYGYNIIQQVKTKKFQ